MPHGVITSFTHHDFPLELLLERKTAPISVVLPAREVAGTVGVIVDRVLALDGLADQVLVVDAASSDGTSEVAARAGAEVVQETDLMPEFGQVLGKGDAMWRALSAVRGDTVLYLDADTRDFQGRLATGLLGPLVLHPELQFVKGDYERPYVMESGDLRPGEGGRVTELAARPLLSAFYPELAAFGQPLAGEVAARRALLQSIPFSTGYAVETAMLLDARDAVGVGAMAQVHLGERLNRHQPLRELGPMAYAVLCVILERLRRDGRLLDDHAPPLQTADGRLVQVELVQRPPFVSLRAPA